MVTKLIILSEVRQTKSSESHLLVMLSAWHDLILSGALEGFYLTFSAEDCLRDSKTLYTM